ncbi:MAG TPA: hypothetical protein DCE41_32160 [Cytophagales bacterium]|nr:hypothetical protein [Cytophagales bacterium]
MRIIYCDSVFDHKTVEPDYEAERQAALRAGFSTSLISFEALTEGSASGALKYVKDPEQKETALYRGWMLTPAQYERLYQGLLQKNLVLPNTPEEYRHCHYLPESYHRIAASTPTSRWTTDLSPENLVALAAEFGDQPIIVKDYVKSEKHHWDEACFIPNALDASEVLKVVNRFLELRSDSLNAGVVFRQFEHLEYLTEHSQSGMPLTMEFRIFFAQKQVLQVYPYWDEGAYGDTLPEMNEFTSLAQNIDSHFFTMDVAKKNAGGWMVMELGDGQVAGLPDLADRKAFYERLGEIMG